MSLEPKESGGGRVLSRANLWRALPLGVLLCACGTPLSPVGPVNLHTVTGKVFYDENGNGTLDPSEGAVVPLVEISLGGHTGRSVPATGRFTIDGVPEATHPVVVSAASLPAFYGVSGSLPMIQVPQTLDFVVPLTLPIGGNTPNTYMGFGDSITVGLDGSTDRTGYRSQLEALLRAHFARGTVLDQGVDATRSDRGAMRINASLQSTQPAYTLILYGTNDWNDLRCQDDPPCFTVDSLRSIVRSVRSARSLPLLATIIPANPNLNPPERNDFVAQIDDLIKPMARQEGAVVVDLYGAFMRQGDITRLFSDHVHPNDAGYTIIANEFFKAITQPAPAGSASLKPGET